MVTIETFRKVHENRTKKTISNNEHSSKKDKNKNTIKKKKLIIVMTILLMTQKNHSQSNNSCFEISFFLLYVMSPSGCIKSYRFWVFLNRI